MSLTNYYEELQKRAAQGKSIRLGMIGFGRFPSTFTVQLDRIPGMQLVGVAELNPARAQKTCDLMEWPKERYSAKTFALRCVKKNKRWTNLGGSDIYYNNVYLACCGKNLYVLW